MIQRRKILIVEDERIVAEGLKSLLTEMGYCVSSIVDSGRKAIEEAYTNPPDIILMDLKLHGDRDGIEVASEIRKVLDIPVIYISAFADEEMVKRATTTEPFAYLQKPVRETDLKSSIEIALYKTDIERQQRKQQQWIETILRDIQSGVIVTDINGKITYLNHCLCDMMGMKRKDCLGKNIDDIFPLRVVESEKEFDIMPTELWELYKSGKFRESGPDLQFFPVRGKPLFVNIRISEIEDETEGISGVVFLVEDVDQVKRYQKDLEREKKSLLRLFEIAELISSTLDQDVLLPKISDSVLEILQTDDCVIFLMDEDEALTPEYSTKNVQDSSGFLDDELERILLQVANKKRSLILNKEESLTEKGNSYIGVPILSQKSILGVIIAISQSGKEFTDKDARMVQLLSSFIAGTIENTHLYSDLQKSLEELKCSQSAWLRSEKLRALGEMADGVAHNFNNFLGVILSEAEVGRLQTDSEDLKDTFTAIISVCKDAAETVKRLKTYTQKEEKKKIHPVNLKEVLSEAIAITRPKWKGEAQKKGISIQIKRDFRFDGAVKANSEALKEALSNIILNAIDALPDGGRIETGTYQKGDTGEIIIGDNGVGIPPADLERIFEPFYSSRLEQGRGLGLSMAHKLITEMNGKIDVESHLGQGTTVRLRFPLFTPSEKVSAPSGALVHKKSLSVLLVDDEKSVLRSYKRLISMMGHKVTAVESGDLAMEQFSSRKFDLVITDLGMPGMNGYQLAERLKKIQPSVPIILLTGWGSEGEEVNISETSVSCILSKPCTMRELSSHILSLVK